MISIVLKNVKSVSFFIAFVQVNHYIGYFREFWSFFASCSHLHFNEMLSKAEIERDTVLRTRAKMKV